MQQFPAFFRELQSKEIKESLATVADKAHPISIGTEHRAPPNGASLQSFCALLNPEDPPFNASNTNDNNKPSTESSGAQFQHALAKLKSRVSKRKGHPTRKIKPVHRLVFCKKSNLYASEDPELQARGGKRTREVLDEASVVVPHSEDDHNSITGKQFNLQELLSEDEGTTNEQQDAEQDVDILEGFLWFATANEANLLTKRRKHMDIVLRKARERASRTPSTTNFNEDESDEQSGTDEPWRANTYYNPADHNYPVPSPSPKKPRYVISGLSI